MTVEIGVLFVIILGMVIIMAWEKLPPDTLAVTIMVVLILGGFVTPSEGLAGMSNQATITILALMILTVGLETTGVITGLGRRLKKMLIGKEWKTLLFLMPIAGIFSAFISTTAIVIVFMRILIKLSKKLPTNLSRLLMPLSFAGILGGSCTLLGTSTNLLVGAIAKDAGLQEFGIFEFTQIGLCLFLVGILYMVLVGRHLIPKRKKGSEDLVEEYAIQGFFTEVKVSNNSDLIGKRVDETKLFKADEIDLIEIRRDEEALFPHEDNSIQAGDVLLIKGSIEKMAELRQKNDLTLLARQSHIDDDRMNTEDMTLCEVIIKPNSRLLGTSLKKVDIKREYNAIPLAVKKHLKYYTADFNELTIEPGDTLLMEVGRANFKYFYNRPEFVVLQEHEELAARSSKRYLAAIIVIVVILLAATNILPILQSSLAGCVAMFLTNCLDLQKAYRRVDWNVFFLLAGVIPLGTAMDNTGASQLIATTFLDIFGDVLPRILVAVLYLVTTLLSSVISNNATAILFAPIAISIALSLGLDPKPLLLTIMFAANMSFITPLGYQTNTLVFSAGHYRFSDFFKVGGILSLLIWILIIWLIPYFYF